MIYVAVGEGLEKWAMACEIRPAKAVAESRKALKENPGFNSYCDDVGSSGMSLHFPFLWKEEELLDGEREFTENLIIEGTCYEW